MNKISKKINKFAILGAGTAGCITASFLKKYTNAEIEWIYDSGIPAQSVGEGSTLPFVEGLFKEVNLNYTTLKMMGGSIKKGVRKVGWKGMGDYLHEFPLSQHAVHFNSKMLRPLVSQRLKAKGVDIVDRKIASHSDIDADYIIDCSGKPDSWEDFNDAEHITVNATHIVQSPIKGPLFDYTLCEARPFGWIFAIPLVERTSCGYMYNKDITTLDEVKQDMKAWMTNMKLPYSEKQNNFEFKNYYRKQNYTDRVCYNGNASFFLEPLEATSVGIIDYINRRLLDSINLDLSIESNNLWYKEKIRESKNMIMMHYFAGSKYDNKFWQFAKKKGKDSMAEMIKSSKFRDIVATVLSQYEDPIFDEMLSAEYGQWPPYSYWQNFRGLNIAKDVDPELISLEKSLSLLSKKEMEEEAKKKKPAKKKPVKKKPAKKKPAKKG